MDTGYSYKLIGDSDMMSRVFREIGKAVLPAILLLCMVLAAEFESFRRPAVIMVSLPFAVIGAVIGLLAAGETANMMSLIGFTMLLGLVTKNAILLMITPTGPGRRAWPSSRPSWKRAPSASARSS